MEANSGKFEFVILDKKRYNKIKLKINSITINKSEKVNLLEISINSNLTFTEHINDLCCNVNYKLYALRK